MQEKLTAQENQQLQQSLAVAHFRVSVAKMSPEQKDLALVQLFEQNLNQQAALLAMMQENILKQDFGVNFGAKD